VGYQHPGLLRETAARIGGTREGKKLAYYIGTQKRLASRGNGMPGAFGFFPGILFWNLVEETSDWFIFEVPMRKTPRL
jgi:hypothetical protein